MVSGGIVAVFRRGWRMHKRRVFRMRWVAFFVFLCSRVSRGNGIAGKRFEKEEGLAEVLATSSGMALWYSRRLAPAPARPPPMTSSQTSSPTGLRSWDRRRRPRRDGGVDPDLLRPNSHGQISSRLVKSRISFVTIDGGDRIGDGKWDGRTIRYAGMRCRRVGLADDLYDDRELVGQRGQHPLPILESGVVRGRKPHTGDCPLASRP